MWVSTICQMKHLRFTINCSIQFTLLKKNNPNCHAALSSPIDRLDDGKAALTIKSLNSLLSESSLDIIDNNNIGHSFLGMHGLHLNEDGVGNLAFHFVKRIRSILNSGSANQKLKEVQ